MSLKNLYKAGSSIFSNLYSQPWWHDHQLYGLWHWFVPNSEKQHNICSVFTHWLKHCCFKCKNPTIVICQDSSIRSNTLLMMLISCWLYAFLNQFKRTDWWQLDSTKRLSEIHWWRSLEVIDSYAQLWRQNERTCRHKGEMWQFVVSNDFLRKCRE